MTIEIEAEGDDDVIIHLPEEEVEESATEVPDETATLKRQLAETQNLLQSERSARQNTEISAQARSVEAHQAQLHSAKQAAESRSAAAQADLAAAKAAYVTANEAGKFAEAADIAERIADARNRLNASQWEIQQVETAARQPPRQQAPQQQVSDDPVTQLISGVKSPEGRRWLTQHQDVARRMALDPRYMARVAGADNMAYAELGTRDTPEYFEFIENQLGLKGGSVSKGDTTAAPARRSASRAATNNGERTLKLSDVVRKLTPDMRKAAQTSFPNKPENEAYKLYAQGLVKAKQSDPSFLPDFKL